MNEEEVKQQNGQQPTANNNTELGQTGTLTLADGSDTGVSVDSAAQADALDPDGFAEIKFEQGNWDSFAQIPNQVSQKTLLVTKTIIPLIDVALIELLGNNKEYERTSFESTFDLASGTPLFSATVKYTIEKWLGNDIKEEYIQQDAQYALNRINVLQGVKFSQCKIDTNDGTLTIAFSL